MKKNIADQSKAVKMKRYLIIATVCSVVLAALMQVGCQKQAGRAPQTGTATTEVIKPRGEESGPKIEFEKEFHDFGEVGPWTTHSCEFRFTNTGDEVLKVEKVASISTCCKVVAELSKTEYGPGESGLVKVTKFRVRGEPGVVREQVTVSSNDKTRPVVKLKLQANVVVHVTHTPKRLRLLLKDENAGAEITVSSTDGEAFAISSIAATSSDITADYDCSVKATSHTVRLNVDTNKIGYGLRGRVTIGLSHPKFKQITIPFVVVARFRLDPPSIVLMNAEPNKPMKKTVWLLNNYGEDFEVESVWSEKDHIKVLSQQKIGRQIGKCYKFELEITPPPAAGQPRFSDIFCVNIKGGEQIKVTCDGFYLVKR